MSQHDEPTYGGYEHRDAEPRWMLLGAIALSILIASAFLVVLGLDDAFERRDARADGPQHPMAGFRTPPTAAPLQAEPRVDYEVFAARQRELLTTYGWVDPAQDLVRLPVERAMDLLAERGLPTSGESER